MALLSSKALGLGHGDPGHANLVQSLFHFVQFERLDDRFDLFHVYIPLRSKPVPQKRPGFMIATADPCIKNRASSLHSALGDG